jgi:hypothetical protein
MRLLEGRDRGCKAVSGVEVWLLIMVLVYPDNLALAARTKTLGKA